ncbi:MAG: hypothetical protein PHQ32_06350 [Firmicutes bacterium]|nr:hypothetical protein [Bacillota bacterium]
MCNLKTLISDLKAKLNNNIKERKKNGLINRGLSIFLISTIIFTSSNLQGVKAFVGEMSTSLQPTQINEVVNEDQVVEESPIIQEIKDERTFNTKSFLHEDFTITVATYPTNVFYKDG